MPTNKISYRVVFLSIFKKFKPNKTYRNHNSKLKNIL